MHKRVIFRTVCIAALVLAVTGCKRKEEKLPTPPAPAAPAATQAVPMEIMEGTEKGKWKAVKIGISDKQKNRDIVATIDIGSTIAIPDTGLTITAHYFFPFFQMKGKKVMSKSNDPVNPAVFLTVTDSEMKDPNKGDAKKMSGYLFARYPASPFNHPRYRFVLMDYIRAQ
jgi:hypothetical protein